MIKRYLFLGIIWIFSLLLSCGSQKDPKLSQAPIIIHLDSAQRHFSLADFIDSLQVVPLESSNVSTISGPSSIDKIILHNNRIYLLDITFSAIKVFDTTGKYLYDIGKVGTGKGEFIRVEDMIYSPYKNSLLVLSNRPNKVTEFSLDGEVIKTHRLPFYAHSMALLSDNLRLFFVNQNRSKLAENQNLLFTDGSNQIQKKMFQMPSNFRSVLKFTGGIFSTSNGVFFSPGLSTSYYYISGLDTCKAVEVNYNTTIDYSKVDPQYLFDNLGKYKFQYSKFIMNNHFVGFNYMNGEYGSAFINKKNNQLLLSDANVDSLNTIFKSSMFQAGEHIFMVFDRDSNWKFLQRHKSELLKRFPDFEKIYETQAVNRNPVLLNFSLKY